MRLCRENVEALECKFVVYVPPTRDDNTDYHLVKFHAHLKDKTTVPYIKLLPNRQRPFWVTREGLRNHHEKKEIELETNTVKYMARQCDLPNAISKVLKDFKNRNNLRKLSASPYLYGSDILSTTLLKKEYQDRYPDAVTPYTVSAFDVETDMLQEPDGRHRDIIMASATFKNRCVTAILKRFTKGHADFENRCREAATRYIGEIMERRGINWEIVFVDTPAQIIQTCFSRLHTWQPDFVAAWNMDFDINAVLYNLKKEGIDPADVFSDPKVPYGHRFFEYKQGISQKVTASGKIQPLEPSEIWNTVFTPASFYFIDPMCVYRRLRIAKGKDPSYSLDAILEKEKLQRKLKFEAADGYYKADWHIFMQEHYPVEYVVYNLYDCIGIEELDDRVKDLQLAVPMQCGPSDFRNFSSQPRRTVDDLHFFVQELGYVYASTSSEMRTDIDDLTVDPDDWIITLPAHLVDDNGLKCIEEYPDLVTNIRVHVADLDVSASYPNGGVVFNTSKATTSREIIEVAGVREQDVRQQGINLSGGRSNAMEFCQVMFGTPSMNEMLAAYQESLGIEPTVKPKPKNRVKELESA